jgi:hypothetical protein
MNKAVSASFEDGTNHNQMLTNEIKKWFKLPKIRKISEMTVKHEVIRKHLLNIIPGCNVRHKHDFDADAVVFYMKISGITKEFKISDEYLQEYTTSELFDFIKQKEVIQIIFTHKKVNILIREGYPAVSYK